MVHEAAHVFHNCRRESIGLRETRSRQYLLNIDFRQRETFAYACEVYGRALELADNHKMRLQLIAEVEEEFVPPDDRVDMEKFVCALSAAAVARNGWKKILQICAPVKQTKTLLSSGNEPV